MSCACDFGTGLNICHCAGCHETFTSVSAFDKHQHLDDDGNAICTDPMSVLRQDGAAWFAVTRRTPAGWPAWGRADSRPHLHVAASGA